MAAVGGSRGRGTPGAAFAAGRAAAPARRAHAPGRVGAVS
jgi:hypothetical protein